MMTMVLTATTTTTMTVTATMTIKKRMQHVFYKQQTDKNETTDDSMEVSLASLHPNRAGRAADDRCGPTGGRRPQATIGM